MEQTHPSAPFPTDPSEFDADERISFSKLDNKFVLVQDDGTEFEFDDALKRWVSTVDEALLEEQQKAYRVSGVDENEPVEALQRKRKKEYINGEDVSSATSPPKSNEPYIDTPNRKAAAQPKPLRKPKPPSPREPTRQST